MVGVWVLQKLPNSVVGLPLQPPPQQQYRRELLSSSSEETLNVTLLPSSNKVFFLTRTLDSPEGGTFDLGNLLFESLLDDETQEEEEDSEVGRLP
jgi:hypothetical protein